jgi:hypothetical protein
VCCSSGLVLGSPSKLAADQIEMPRTTVSLAAIALLPSLSGCAWNYIGTGYATVPVQLVMTRQGPFEILDRPELGRIAISPPADRATRRFDIENFLHRTVTGAPLATDSTTSPGSWYFEPLMAYFGQTGRTCRLIRGQPLVEPQWEFVYDCTPGFDASAITWKSSGFSNAPLPPPPVVPVYPLPPPAPAYPAPGAAPIK